MPIEGELGAGGGGKRGCEGDSFFGLPPHGARKRANDGFVSNHRDSADHSNNDNTIETSHEGLLDKSSLFDAKRRVAVQKEHRNN